MRRWQGHRLMLPGRVTALALLALALLQPASEQRDNATLALLVDYSASVSPTAVAAAERRLAAELEHVDGRVTINGQRFGVAPAETSLRDALADAFRSMPPSAGNVVLLVSDGYWAQDAAPRS